MRRKEYVTQRSQIVDFSLGFAGWYVLNGFAWALVGPSYGILNCLLLPLNILLVIGFFVSRRWLGFGILGALALNLIIALIIGAVLNGTCAIPFWISDGSL